MALPLMTGPNCTTNGWPSSVRVSFCSRGLLTSVPVTSLFRRTKTLCGVAPDAWRTFPAQSRPAHVGSLRQSLRLPVCCAICCGVRWSKLGFAFGSAGSTGLPFSSKSTTVQAVSNRRRSPSARRPIVLTASFPPYSLRLNMLSFFALPLSMRMQSINCFSSFWAFRSSGKSPPVPRPFALASSRAGELWP